MSKNILYNFVEYKQKQLESALPQGIISLVKDTTLQEKEYFRFELAKEDFSFDLGDLQLTLVNHHVSIYRTQNHSHAEKSQYHFTGKFVDGEGQVYILHSHFNDEDELTKAPILEKREGETSERISTKSATHLLSQFSRLKTETLIVFLKEELRKEVDSLINQSELCEKEACELFSELEKDKAAYWSKIDSLGSLYNNLTPLVKQDQYEKLARLLINMKKQFQSKTKTVSKSQDEASVSSEDEEIIITKPNLVVTLNPEPITKDLETINTLFNRFSTHEKSEIFAGEFADMHAKVYGLIALLESKSHSATHEEMNALLKIQRDIYKKMEQIFPILLFKNQFESITHFSIFHNFIAVKHFNLALMTRNKAFLACILSIKGTEFLNQAVTIKGIKYTNALVYCFEQPKPDEKLTDCFAVLVKNKAPLMTADTRGCPIAYSLLCASNNPLTVRMKEEIKEQPYFWKNLISALNLYLGSTKDLNENERLKIKEHIATYQINKEFLKTNYNFFNQQMGIWGPLTEKSLEILPEDFVAKLNEDPQIKFQSDRIPSLLDAYFKVLPSHERQKIKKCLNLASKDLVEKILSKKFDFPNYQELRTHTLIRLQATVSSLELMIEAQRIINQLKNPRKLNSRAKKDLKECNQLLAKVKGNSLIEDILPEEIISQSTTQKLVLEIMANALIGEDLAKAVGTFLQQKVTDEGFQEQKFHSTLNELSWRIERVDKLYAVLSVAKLTPVFAEMVQTSYELTFKNKRAIEFLSSSLTKLLEEAEAENQTNLTL